jgi:hypothetical protein
MPPKIENKLKQANITCQEIVSKCICPKCQKEFTTRGNLTRHLKISCSSAKRYKEDMINQMAEQIKYLVEGQKERDLAQKERDLAILTEVKNIAKDVEVIKENPMIIHPISNNLNVMCLGSKDNLLDILTLESSRPHALTLIKNCALSRSGGDCHILEKVYLPKEKRPALMYANKSKTQYVYYNENNTRIVENNSEVIAKKLAGILQRTYSKGIGFFKTDVNGDVRDSLEGETIEIEASDRDNWNSHIQDLQNPKYQKSILKSMHIPFEKDVKVKYP